jgi:Uma2 family endonuclease
MKRQSIAYSGGVFTGGEPLGPMTVRRFLRMPETRKREELVYGFVLREPSSPTPEHQESVLTFIELLRIHVRALRLGRVIADVDVVLDEHKRLVVRPDVMVIFSDRLHQVRDRLWGAPNVVIEVLSPKTRKRDRQTKLEWYRTYGVHEYWIVDVKRTQIDVIDFSAPPDIAARSFTNKDVVESKLLPEFRHEVEELVGQSVIYGREA